MGIGGRTLGSTLEFIASTGAFLFVVTSTFARNAGIVFYTMELIPSAFPLHPIFINR